MSILSFVFLLHFAAKLPVMFLYAGPDQLLPLASFIGAVIGILLIVWQRLVMFVKKIISLFSSKSQPSTRK